jgi:autotransporter translocation and assembly factor TamB
MRIAGLLDAKLDARGDSERARIDAKLSLRDGRVDKFKDLTSEVAATLHEDGTVGGTVRVVAPRVGNLAATFKGPATASPPTNAPIRVALDVTHVQVANLPLPPEANVKADGNLEAHLQLRGTIGDPRLTVQVTGHRMTLERSGDLVAKTQAVSFEDVTVDATYASPRLEAGLSLVDDQHGSLRAAVTSRIPLSELTTPGALAITTRPVSGSLRLKDLDPAAISAFVPTLKVVRGQISALFQVKGTVAEPRLGGEMRWRKGELVVVPEKSAAHDPKGAIVVSSTRTSAR